MTVLVIAAHPDDEVLGLGGTIAAHCRAGNNVVILVVTEGCSSQYPGQPELIRRKEEEALKAAALLGGAEVVFARLPDMKLDTLPLTVVNRCIEDAVQAYRPELVYTHSAHDINRDHRILYEATCVACRPYAAPFLLRCYTYYVPSSSEWGGTPFHPNVFTDISETMELKIQAMAAYGTEVRLAPHPRAPEQLRTLAAYFGSVAGCPFAEAFQLVREINRPLRQTPVASTTRAE